MSLKDGSLLGLSQRILSDDWECVYCKLTDTSLKSIEDYFSRKLDAKPSISFQADNGILTIPDSSGVKQFTFVVSDLPEGGSHAQGSHDCVQQMSDSELTFVGSMKYRVCIKGNQDSYAQMKDRVNELDDKDKNSLAKEITHGSKNSSKKGRKQLPNGTTFHNSAVSQLIRPAPRPAPRASPFSNHAAVSPAPQVTDPVIPGSTNGSMTQERQRTAPSIPSSRGRLTTAEKKPVNSSISVAPPASQVSVTKAVNPRLAYPIRERILHQLILKPYRKPELALKLKEEGLADGITPAQMDEIIQEISLPCKGKTRKLTLAKEFYHEVRLDWEFFTESDRVTVKSKIMGADGVNPPTKSDVPVTLASKGAKAEEVSTKKKRSSNMGTISSTLPSKKSKNENENDTPKVADRKVADRKVANEFLSEFRVIIAPQQRLDYVAVFNQDYSEYVTLFHKVMDVCSAFKDLNRQFNGAPESDKKKIEEEIFQKYQDVKKGDYFVQKERFHHLQLKLTHIKSLVAMYDKQGET